MRARSTILAVALVVLGAVTPGTATAAVDPDCLNDPVIGNGIFGEDLLPVLTTKNEPVNIAVWGALLQDCPNTTVTARTPGGGLITVPLNQNLPDKPPDYPERLGGVLTLPLGYGAGIWQLTKITSGGTSKTLHHPFDVHRGGVVTLNNMFAVFAPKPVAVAGTVKHYTPLGTLAPSSNTRVAVYSSDPGYAVRKQLTTNAAGSFTGTIAFQPGMTAITAEVASDDGYYYTDSPKKNAVVAQPQQGAIPPESTTYSTTGYVNQFWRVDSSPSPASMWNDLKKSTSNGWLTTGSFGYTTAGGHVTRWWKPLSPGTYYLRLDLGISGVYTNGPIQHDITVTVKSKQTVPTYVDATVGPTNGSTVYPGTAMSGFGHLKVRYSNGTVGPFANQRIVIQTRPHGTTDWSWTLGSVTTNANGYFLRHWTNFAEQDMDIRFLYLSPYVTIKNGAIVKSNIQVTP